MPNKRYKVTCALCNKVFDNDYKGNYVSHMDQLSVVARYVDQDGYAQERLVDMRNSR